ncbi:DNA gyrase inhibitor YacG [Piscinibacter sp. Jin2]|uniref:DNA gyrase inhibitor YacG n=1 Tax=Aquariibacter lacus TaxID=2801332 RepID=A0A9X0XCQ3_9BURK|nr:DNA gyrase inhibitor YacG [Piscinibacter lacus]MBL0719154.1 DNA gyrase inhibitor YacG [Piscinibacter lacus]
MSTSPRPAPRLPCPTCRRPSLFAPENPWRPFCSEACREIDLGAWASADYRVPSEPLDPGVEESSANPRQGAARDM